MRLRMKQRLSAIAIVSVAGVALLAQAPSPVFLASGSTAGPQVEDLTAPLIAQFDISPSTINVIGAGQDVQVTERLTDDLSGVSFGCFFLRSPSGQQVRNGCNQEPYTRISGTSRDGVYRATLNFPQFSETGTWHVLSAYVVDVVGNVRSYDEQGLIDAGFSTHLEVVAATDLLGPVIAGFAMTPDPIDVSDFGGANLTITEHLTDDSAGVSYSCFFLRSPSGRQNRNACNQEPYTRVSGTDLDGIYEARLLFPQFSEAGTWHVISAYVVDFVGNGTFYDEQALISAGIATTVEVISVPDDEAPAVIAGFVLSPSTIDTSSDAQVVRVIEHLADNLSGISYSCFFLRSPSGQQIRNGCNEWPHSNVSGDILDGVYESALTFPQFSETGVWHVFSAYAYDAVGNGVFLDEQGLVDLGFSTELLVTNNQPPIARAASTPTAVCAGSSGGGVTLDGSASTDPNGDWLTYTWRENGAVVAGPSGSAIATVTLSLGTHHIELTVEDGKGGSDRSQLVVEVVDTTPPALTVALSPNVLWPPDHRLMTIAAGIEVTDSCDASPRVELVSIASNEADNGLGDGDTAGDIQQASIGADDRTFLLRTERSGRGIGRTYTVTYRATDASGNSTTATATVTVPKSAAKQQ